MIRSPKMWRVSRPSLSTIDVYLKLKLEFISREDHHRIFHCQGTVLDQIISAVKADNTYDEGKSKLSKSFGVTNKVPYITP